ncbi:MAG: Ig-like domain-containing protein, partial [Cyanobacteria bacterium]|nr:Ig-like domain-containing protein [Cyanobacteriota bacterium]
TTLLATGEKIQWQPATNANGTLNAFSISAYDGSLASASPLLVQVAVNPVNDRPTLTTISTITGGTEDTVKEITYADLLAASNAADVDGDALSFRIDSISSGTLNKWSGSLWQPVTPGTTLLATGEKIQWQPATNANGTLNAFSISAYDGSLASASPLLVQVAVTRLTRNGPRCPLPSRSATPPSRSVIPQPSLSPLPKQ